MRLYIQQRKHAFTKSLSLNLIIKKNLEKTDMCLLIWKSRNTFSTVVFSSNLGKWCFTSPIVQFNFSLFVSQRVQWQSSGLDKMSNLERRTIYIKLAKWIYQWFGKYIATEFYPLALSLFSHFSHFHQHFHFPGIVLVSQHTVCYTLAFPFILFHNCGDKQQRGIELD